MDVLTNRFELYKKRANFLIGIVTCYNVQTNPGAKNDAIDVTKDGLSIANLEKP